MCLPWRLRNTLEEFPLVEFICFPVQSGCQGSRTYKGVCWHITTYFPVKVLRLVSAVWVLLLIPAGPLSPSSSRKWQKFSSLCVLISSALCHLLRLVWFCFSVFVLVPALWCLAIRFRPPAGEWGLVVKLKYHSMFVTKTAFIDKGGKFFLLMSLKCSDNCIFYHKRCLEVCWKTSEIVTLSIFLDSWAPLLCNIKLLNK